MLDLIAIGTISIDFFFRGESLTEDNERFHLALGGKYVADELYEGVGGGGANVAIGAKHFGLDVAVFGLMGDNPFKEVILHALNQNGIHTHLIQVKKDYFSISSILLSKTGDRSVIHYESPHEDLFTKMKDKHDLLDCSAVYLGNLPDISLVERTELLKFVRENGIMTFLNLGVHDLRKSKDELMPLISFADVLILNGHEFAELMKKKYEEIRFESDITVEEPILHKRVVIITDGEKGSYSYEKGLVYRQEAVRPEKILDTTGAGDGYSAGFIVQYLKSKDVKKSMRQGAEYASTILSKIGAN